MLWKIITLVGAALALWSMLRRATGAATPTAPSPRREGVEEFVRCDACGSWNPPGSPCACRTPPTP